MVFVNFLQPQFQRASCHNVGPSWQLNARDGFQNAALAGTLVANDDDCGKRDVFVETKGTQLVDNVDERSNVFLKSFL